MNKHDKTENPSSHRNPSKSRKQTCCSRHLAESSLLPSSLCQNPENGFRAPASPGGPSKPPTDF